MKEASLIAWRSFLESGGAPYTCVSEPLATELKQAQILPIEKLLDVPPIEESLDAIHYSWFSPFLRTLPEKDIKLFLSCLLPPQARGLKQALLLSNALPTLLPIGKTY